MIRPAILSAVLLASFTSAVLADEEPDKSILTVDRIYGKREFDAKRISVRWLEDRDAYLTIERNGNGQAIVEHDAETGAKKTVVASADLKPTFNSTPIRIDDYAFSADRSKVLIYTNSKRVWRRNTRGDYWVLDRSSHELTQLGGDVPSSSLMFAKFSPDGSQVAYVHDNDIYVEDVATHEITQLTNRESKKIINGTFDWVYEEELFLRDGFRWSPDGRRIAYWQLDTSGVREVTLVHNLDGLYPQPQQIPYPKVGETNSAGRVGVVDLATKKTKWMNVPGDPRNHYIARMQWHENSNELVLQQLNRLQNTNRIMFLDSTTSNARTIHEETDDAWVNVHDEMKWLDGGKRFTWISESDGWRHIQIHRLHRSLLPSAETPRMRGDATSAKATRPPSPQPSPASGRGSELSNSSSGHRRGSKSKTITCGDYDVIRLLHVDEPSEWCYFLASPDDPTQCYLYRVRFNGKAVQRVTPTDSPGWNSYQISRCGNFAVHSRSRFDKTPTTHLIRLPSHEPVRSLVDNKKFVEKVAKLKLGKTEFFRVDIGNGIALDARAITPPNFNADKKYPLLVYVYGEPAGQTVVDRWGGSNYLWHQMLAQQGYVVMTFENRGAPAPRGREWRKSVYRQVGILAPADQAAAVKAELNERPYLDSERVGIWGWSGGGSMSLNAIFKYPDLYKTAIAIAPVPNQRFYDTIYQERYMGLPKDNVNGYLNGSPINFAHQLKGNLLLIHGTGDDNCHYQGTEALINELVRHNKPFTMMAYPSRTHGIGEGANTTLHLKTLMTSYLHKHLPPGAK